MVALITHPVCHEHQMEQHHPESPERLKAVLSHLNESGLIDDLTSLQATEAFRDDLTTFHSDGYVDDLEAMEPHQGLRPLNPDTSMGPKSLTAARYAAGAAVQGVDLVLADAGDDGALWGAPPPLGTFIGAGYPSKGYAVPTGMFATLAVDFTAAGAGLVDLWPHQLSTKKLGPEDVVWKINIILLIL